MSRCCIFFLVLSLFFQFGCSQEKENAEVASQTTPSLKGMKFSSEFFHYVNFYSFETDSTGFSENGQLAWSMSIDPSLGIPDDEVLYEGEDEFAYLIEDSVLTIRYLSPNHPESDKMRIFYYRKKHDDWISEHEFTYGREYLQEVSEKVLTRSW